MLKITSAEILISAPSSTHMPVADLPEIAFLGRSNVGKSSLINSLLKRRSLARTSSQPGKTRLFNFYLINKEFFLVDMPGYGYARFSQEERKSTRQAIETYITTRAALCLVLHVLDFRHPPSADDVEFSAALRLSDTRFKVVATKVDKVARSQHSRHRKAIVTALGLAEDELLVTSSVDRLGQELVWRYILDHAGLGTDVQEFE